MVQIMMNESYVNIPRHDVLREPRDTRHGDLQIWIFGSDNMQVQPISEIFFKKEIFRKPDITKPRSIVAEQWQDDV
jgi:hypothetical protein